MSLLNIIISLKFLLNKQYRHLKVCILFLVQWFIPYKYKPRILSHVGEFVFWTPGFSYFTSRVSDKYIHCFAWIYQRDTSQACLLGQNRLEFGHFRMRSRAESYKKCRAQRHAKWGLAHPTRATAHSALTSFLPRAPTRSCAGGQGFIFS